MKRLPPSKNFKNYTEEELYLQARKKVEKIKGFYVHFAVYIVINIVLLTIIAANMDAGDNFWTFGHFSTAIFWGVGVAFHALGAFGTNLFFGKNWEDRKIREYIDREKERSSGWE
ncbi:2TM domain-containing protein [Kordia jejudonensis]|uniref:2TM domain-containing protein n=1 Tax=Kordia jejudonensis TaxID=1348245 RepID=UPI000629272A|nr:2TM domain-containing protein [Kordia jejudonensis]